MQTEPSTRAVRKPIAPLVPVLLAVVAGIVLDRYGPSCETNRWLAATVAATAAAILSRRREACYTVAIVLAFTSLGAAWHHARWSDLAADDVSRIAGAREQPAWLRGVPVDLPEYRPQTDVTRVVLDVTGASDGLRWLPASGRVQATIPGDRSDLVMGKPVFAAGRLAEIPGPKNPGELDYRLLMRAHGIRARLSIPSHHGLWPDPESPSWPYHLALGRMRTWSARRLESGLDPDVVPLASALLLGRRALVPGDLNDAFARTGTTHLLAISGLHLQVLALALGWICMACGIDRKRACWIVGIATTTYGCLVGWSPSVTRSVAMTVVLCFGFLKDRRPAPANLLALAALATLALNPSDLFDVGCQLSFLAVSTLFWIVRPCLDIIKRLRVRPRFDAGSGRFSLISSPDPLDELERAYERRWRTIVRGMRWKLIEGMSLSAIVWAVGLPLVALRFHVSSPIAIALNVPLVPLTSFALMLAGATLFLSAVHPALAFPVAWLCKWSLMLTRVLVLWGERQPWGHAFVTGPSWWWVLGFYTLLALAVWRSTPARRSTPSRPFPSLFLPPFRPAAVALAVWLLVPLMARYTFSQPHTLVAEVLAVDHGLSVILQAEPRHATVYDCGRMRDPSVGRRMIAPALWARGVERIDAVILSHADSDHYNGLPDLIDRFPIGVVLVPPGFGGGENHEASALLDLVRSRGIPVRNIVSGDRVSISSHVDALVVHPSADFSPNAPDNAHSVVLELEHQRRRILLTGDLDGEGRSALLRRKHETYDAVLSPHHGGRTANPPLFFDWARPGLVLASQREPAAGSTDALKSLDLPLLRTWDAGAIQLAWNETGLNTSAFLKDVQPKIRLQSPPPDDPRPSLPIRAVAIVVGTLAGLLLCLLLVIVEWGAWTLIRPGRPKAAPSVEPAPWSPISITAHDGSRLSGAWRTAENGDGRTVLLLHGFGEDRTALLDRAEWISSLGLHVALLDSRGRGPSEGPFTTFGALESTDLASWFAHFQAQVGDSAPIIAWGRSMGSSIALRSAAEGTPFSALILEAPYADLTPTVGSWLRLARIPRPFARPILWRAGLLCGVSLTTPRPLENARDVNFPVLLLHGSADPIVTDPEVRRLASSFPSPPVILSIPAARHSDVFPLAYAEIRAQIAEFLTIEGGDSSLLQREKVPRSGG